MPLTLLDILPLGGVREPFSALSHLLGALGGVIALLALVQQAYRRGLHLRAVRCLFVYGMSMVLVFTASALFHLLNWPAHQLVLFWKLDHAAIFLIIAGTGTAVYGTLPVRWGRHLIAVTWLVALSALAAKMIAWPMTPLSSAFVYLAVGSVPAAGTFRFARLAGWEHLKLLVAGMAVFVVSALVFVAEWPIVWPGVIEGHEVFHVLVLLGMGLHYGFIYRACTLFTPPLPLHPSCPREVATPAGDPAPKQAPCAPPALLTELHYERRAA